MSKILDYNGLEHYDEKIKDYIDEHGGTEEVYIGTTEPTGDEKIWINPDGEESQVVTKDYVDGEIERVEGEIPEISVSDTGTATDEVQYITIDGVEKKLAGGGAPDNMVTTDTAQTITGEKTFNKNIKFGKDSNNYGYGLVNSYNRCVIQTGSYGVGVIIGDKDNPMNNTDIYSTTQPRWHQQSFADRYKTLATTDQIPTVEANPENPTQTLSSIKIGDVDYSVGGGGSSYTFTNGLTESGGTVSWDLNDRIKIGDNVSTSETSIDGGVFVNLTDSIISFQPTKDVTIGRTAATNSIAIGSRASAGSKKFGSSNNIAIGTNATVGDYINNGIVIGNSARATDARTVAIGYSVEASTDGQIVLGRQNKIDNNQIFIIGNGTSSTARSNALTVSKTGILECANIPAPPTSDGEYNLHCSIVNGVPTYTWKAEV